MGRSCCLAVVLIIAVLVLFFYQGSGRKVMAFKKEHLQLQQQEGNPEKGREMIQVMDYSDPEPNTNPKDGNLSNPPSLAPPQG